MRKPVIQFTARIVFLSMAIQLIWPVYSYALTSGPSQPEVQSFEPVGTTDMVNLFSGDFNYNIPLMDVEGYPVNIAYHSGIGVEQEASWVGLGWNINPGEINRTVRGLPDDFNGATIEKELNIRPEKNYRVGVGSSFGVELLGGHVNVGLSLNTFLNYNNYKGMSAGATTGVNASLGYGGFGIGAGINMGIGSQTGADMDLSASVGAGISRSVGNEGGSGGVSVTVSGGTGFNSRTGLKDLSFGIGVSGNVSGPGQGLASYKDKEGKVHTNKMHKDANTVSGSWFSYSSTIPIGLQNYVPVVTNAAVFKSYRVQQKLGGEVYYMYPSMNYSVMVSSLEYEKNGTRKGYGYLYLENAPESAEAILDFSRDKDGLYNKTLPNLPLASLTYDIYTISGQGTGGMFRPFRNDIGTVYDPLTSATTSAKDVLLEAGAGNLFELGSDANFYENHTQSGPWNKLSFAGDMPGNLYEKAYFKQAGELTYNQQSEVTGLFNDAPQYLKSDGATLGNQYARNAGELPQIMNGTTYWHDGTEDRSARANLLTYLTAGEAALPEIGQTPQFHSYANSETGNNRYFDPAVTTHNRYNNIYAVYPQKDHIGEFTQTLPDGRRYTYGIPAMNNATREVVFNVDESNANIKNGLVKMLTGDDTKNNSKGREHFYSSTTTPAYAHSYLLTSVLSNDYVDIMGDGPTDDDLGTFVKFNYALVDNDYRWRAPYPKDSVQYNPGFYSDYRDGKGNYIVGSRQQWHLRTIESKNYVAEFYISPREDGKGSRAAVLLPESGLAQQNSALKNEKSEQSISYKLDSIRLFNKHDRYLNEENAVPVKTVIFTYSYKLCPGTPNSTASAGPAEGRRGKLTLEKIYVKYGKSEKSLLSPYVFEYNNPNPSYDFAAKDRWGSYKSNTAELTNYEFPYTPQEPAGVDSLASWNLTDIKLPSGGNIHVDYESDDYSFVQDRRAMQMFPIKGVGSSPYLEQNDRLYDSENDVNNYVYFKRRKDKERPGVSLKDNYLEGQDLLYYSFNLDITGHNRYEHIKAYASVEEVGYCDGDPDSDYGYIKLKKEPVKSLNLHPATIYGLNIARYYLPHVLYKGFPDSDGDKQVLMGLIEAAEELVAIGQNPFKRFVQDGKGRNIRISKSWIRLQVPGLTKKGGGIRVKQLALNDSWNSMTTNPDNATYGKVYDYTIEDSRYGKISSGVASYEPIIGGDENPWRMPVPYQAESGKLLPAIDFFQEEPYGESFFPPAGVGYSSVKVRSIHADPDNGRSSQSEEEHLFYTSKDFPSSVQYTAKEAPEKPIRTRSLRLNKEENYVLQGAVLRFNDMHGKLKAVNNYLLKKGTNGYKTRELVTGTRYHYKQSATGKLDNTVKALCRSRGSVNHYEIRDVTLGKEMDFTVDSRQRFFRSFNRNVAININVVMWGVYPVPIPTAFFPDKEEVQLFKMQVSTKIIQQYGILNAVEQYDHGAVTRMENMLYDAETGGVLLSSTNNEYSDKTYNLQYPAYLAYNNMGPAYANTGYYEYADSMVVNDLKDGYLYANNIDRYNEGDELLVHAGSGGKITTYKLWVVGFGTNPYPEVPDPPSGGDPDPDPGDIKGKLVVWISNNTLRNNDITLPIIVSCGGKAALITNGSTALPQCDAGGSATFELSPGPVDFYAFTLGGNTRWTWYSTTRKPQVIADACINEELLGFPSAPGYASRPVSEGSRCAVKVAPRYKGKFADNAPATNLSGWPVSRKAFDFVYVKVIRSGKRNNLTNTVQRTALSQNPFPTGSTIHDLFDNSTQNGNAFSTLLNVSANTFTDSARAYADHEASLNYLVSNAGTNSDYRYTEFNKFVMGYRGNYRSLAEYVRHADRTYINHARHDGIFPLVQPFWDFDNAARSGTCNSVKDVLLKRLISPVYWAQAREVTKYDVHGNALEEKDAIGNYTAAQYGYNKQLPLAVASNARQDNFLFEGFDDYLMLMPQYLRRMYVANPSGGAPAAYRNSPFASLFTKSGENYSSGGNGVYVMGPLMQRYKQKYSALLNQSQSGFQLSNEAAHSGYYSLKCTAAQAISIPVVAADPAHITAFHLVPGKKYLVNAWVKSTGGNVNPSGLVSISQGGTSVSLSSKTAAIDGWYLVEGVLDLPSNATTAATFNLPANIYIDDIRIFPADANMKSFVYDPLTFRLNAQLDENHFTTFYEYDQEGLLIRVKKETDRGIMTISESRRSNAKNTP